MTEGVVPITLLEPDPTAQDSQGQKQKATPIEHSAWAKRVDRSGIQRLHSDTQVGEWKTRWEMRQDGFEMIDNTWMVRDDRGRIYTIESVSEATVGGHNRWWWIYSIARQ